MGYELAGHAVLFQADYKIVFHHGPLSDGASYQTMILWDLFTNCLEAAEILKVDPEAKDGITLRATLRRSTLANGRKFTSSFSRKMRSSLGSDSNGIGNSTQSVQLQPSLL